jgi:hypothetical protein
MHGSALPDELVLVHQLIGYTTAFVIAPLALLAFAEPQRHRGWAKTYLYLMIPLYLSGLYFTFQRHELGTFVWARNLAFNFLGFYFLLLGWRAIWRFRRQAVQPTALDHAMRALLLAVSATLVALGGLHHFPSFVFGALGLWLGLAVFRDTTDVRDLYVRHQRCVLASFYYVLTVLSIVHFRAPADVKWLWPALVGLPLIVYATRRGQPRERTRRAVHATFAIAMLVGVYVAIAGTGLIPRIAPVAPLTQG